MKRERSEERKQPTTHSPTLNTIMMVEEVLKASSQPITVAELKRRVPKKVMHSTLLQILDYLQISRKLLITTKGIVWTFKESKELDNIRQRGQGHDSD